MMNSQSYPKITITCAVSDHLELANLLGTEYPWPDELSKVKPQPMPVVVSVDISRDGDKAKIELTYGIPE